MCSLAANDIDTGDRLDIRSADGVTVTPSADRISNLTPFILYDFLIVFQGVSCYLLSFPRFNQIIVENRNILYLHSTPPTAENRVEFRHDVRDHKSTTL